MSASTPPPAEVLKLAKTMDVDPAELHFLAEVPADDLAQLRRQVGDALFRADRHLFARVAALSKTVPVAVSAKLTEAALPPLLAARTAELLEPAKAAELVGKVSAPYLADVSAAMDASRAPDVVAAIPPDRVAAVAAELARRREWVVIGGFVSHVSDDALRGSVRAYDGEQLLHIAFLMDDLDRIDVVSSLLTDDQLDEVLAAAAAKELWSELTALLEHVRPARLERLQARYAVAPADVVAAFEQAVAAGDLAAAELDRLRAS